MSILRKCLDDGDVDPDVRITYFEKDLKKDGGNYITVSGRVKKVHEYRNVVIFENGKRFQFDIEQGSHIVQNCMDELDNDLHPHLLPRLLDLFKHKHSNPHDAQIIFSCHTPEILNLLYKHQVYMVQKNNQESESWRLDEVTGLRADDNIYAKYMSGALDAVPNI